MPKRALQELLNVDEPAWPLVQSWLREATNPVEVLPEALMNALVARIKARVADPPRAVDAAAWVCPRPAVVPPATVAEVDAAAAALGFAIPPLLRRLYT